MKIGVPTFGYQYFSIFEQQLRDGGFYTANLGDNMQSIAIRLLLKRLRVQDGDVISVDRDGLRHYAGPPVALIMNGVFMESSFPLAPQVKPLFIGFHASEDTIAQHREFFAMHQPIGCRDKATAEHFARHGIQAHVTGCLTMTIPPRSSPVGMGKVIVVYGGTYSSGASYFPSPIFKKMPPEYFHGMEFVYQRIPVAEYPLNAQRCQELERYAFGLLEYYAANARLVITPLHHAATPCMALGIPVILCRETMDSRFSYLEDILPVYTPDKFECVDWEPAAVEMGPIRNRLEGLLLGLLASTFGAHGEHAIIVER